MIEKKREVAWLYDPVETSERIGDLRKPEGKTKYTLDELSRQIKEKTGVYISPVQLGKYENADLKEKMNINNLLAIAAFYEVSIDFLLGKTECEKADNIAISKRFRLSEKAIGVFEQLSQSEQRFNPFFENENFYDLVFFTIKHADCEMFSNIIKEMEEDLSWFTTAINLEKQFNSDINNFDKKSIIEVLKGLHYKYKQISDSYSVKAFKQFTRLLDTIPDTYKCLSRVRNKNYYRTTIIQTILANLQNNRDRVGEFTITPQSPKDNNNYYGEDTFVFPQNRKNSKNGNSTK